MNPTWESISAILVAELSAAGETVLPPISTADPTFGLFADPVF